MPSTFITKFWSNECRPWLSRQVVADRHLCLPLVLYCGQTSSSWPSRAHASKSGQKVALLCTCNSHRLADVAFLGSWKRAQGPQDGMVSLGVNCLRLSLCWDAGERHLHSLAAEPLCFMTGWLYDFNVRPSCLKNGWHFPCIQGEDWQLSKIFSAFTPQDLSFRLEFLFLGEAEVTIGRF